MNSVALYEGMVKVANRELAAGTTYAQMRARADKQEKNGESVSAVYTRLIAAIMRKQ